MMMYRSQQYQKLQSTSCYHQRFCYYSVILHLLLTLLLVVATAVLGQNYTDPHIDDATAYSKIIYVNETEKAIKDGYIVVFNKTRVAEIVSNLNITLDEIVGNLTREGGKLIVEKIVSSIGMVQLKVLPYSNESLTDEEIEKRQRAHTLLSWLKNSLVEYMEEDQIATITQQQEQQQVNSNDQSFPTWGLDRIDQETLPLNNQYHSDQNGTGVIAYIIDTGIRSTHLDFTGRASCPISFIPNEECDDMNGHGTHVAGTIGSITYGVAKAVTLVGVKVLANDGSGSNSGVLKGIDYVLQQALQDTSNTPKVCNLSLGGLRSRALDSAITQLADIGKVFVSVAAGNDNMDACLSSPAGASQQSRTILSVGAIDNTDRRSIFSNYGNCVSIFAPGTNIESTWYTSDTATNTISGTSMASPHVAGVAALYLQLHQDATPNIVSQEIINGGVLNVLSDVQSSSPNVLLNTQFLFKTIPASPPDSSAWMISTSTITSLLLLIVSVVVFTI